MSRSHTPNKTLVTAALALAMLPATLFAQDRIPAEIIQATTITQQSEQQLRSITRQTVLVLVEPDADLRKRTRRNLTSPLTRSDATDAFRNAYSLVLVDELRPLLSDASFETRLNAAIILSYLHAPQALDLAGQALDDENPAVRYWAARCFEDITPRVQLTNQQLLGHADLLAGRLATETSDITAIRLVEALDAFSNPDAYQPLIDALFTRATTDSNSLAPEERALTATFQWLIRARSEGVNIEPILANLSALVIVNAQVATERLQQDPEAPNAAELIRVSDQVLDLARETFFPNTPAPGGSLSRYIPRAEWTQVLQALQSWKTLLADPTVNLSQQARDALNNR
ncbi:MAG: HEAT repeat domain-containing protein [Phycisphaeraceae bacterium]